WLDFRHTVFGQVYEGMDVVDAIANAPRNGNDRPLEEIKILSVDVTEFEA
ncbi:MAG: peptidylprolyl isomerase, partial [Clostridia bacterium]|nr:peptidylprolyl isomerase [Clostridia bacterium]